MEQRQIKILYVCPFAHYKGHSPYAATNETGALQQAGIKVTLLTFCGVIGDEVKVTQATVSQHIGFFSPLYHMANLARRWQSTRRFSMFLETLLTLIVAIQLRRKLNFDIIHLRDGEPFLFLIHVFGCFLLGYKWAVSLTGTNLINYPPMLATLKKDFRLFIYILLLRIVNSGLWKPIYRRSLRRNIFIFMTQNESIKQRFELYMGGILSGKVIFVPLGVGEVEKPIPKDEARRHLGIPQGKSVFLSFGFQHVGKDAETMVYAMKDIPDTLLLHGGAVGWDHNLTIANLVEKYGMREKAVVKESYISEEKPYYFFAADAMILSYRKDFASTASLLWEACRFGVPVIASNSGQLKELVEAFHLGLPFLAQDAGSLEKAIVQFIRLKPEEIELFRDNCHRFCLEFSAKKWAESCIQIYDNLLKI